MTYFVSELRHNGERSTWVARDIGELEEAAQRALGDNGGRLWEATTYAEARRMFAGHADMMAHGPAWAWLAVRRAGVVVERPFPAEPEWFAVEPARTEEERVEAAHDAIARDLRGCIVESEDEVRAALEDEIEAPSYDPPRHYLRSHGEYWPGLRALALREWGAAAAMRIEVLLPGQVDPHAPHGARIGEVPDTAGGRIEVRMGGESRMQALAVWETNECGYEGALEYLPGWDEDAEIAVDDAIRSARGRAAARGEAS